MIVPGATVALTRRTTLRKSFLAPWHPLVDQLWLYSLADAQRVHDVAVHQSVLVLNHHHTSVTASRANLPEFTQRVHRDFSCAVHTLLCEQRYDAPREVFDDRPTHMMRLMDPAAQASHLIYEHLNPVAAGLVQRPEDMPQRMIDFRQWKTSYIEVERPPLYFGADRPERLRLHITPPPVLYWELGGDLDKLVYHMQRLSDQGQRALRAARTRPVMGAKALRRLHPWSEPRTMRESGPGSLPTFKFGAHDLVTRERRRASSREVSAFRRAHEAARLARREGDFEAKFPFGTYAMRTYHGVPTEHEPPLDAMVAQPGPLLSDVQAELEREGRGSHPLPTALLDEVREALRSEAGEMIEDAEIDRPEPRTGRIPDVVTKTVDEGHDDSDEPDRDLVVVRHRFDRRDRQAARPARRIVTLRDRRRGRPPRGSGTHGSDPPG